MSIRKAPECKCFPCATFGGIKESFYATLGRMVFNSPFVSYHMGHSTCLGTWRDYYHPSAHKTPEIKAAVTFLQDLAKMTPEEILGKWYGVDEDGSPTQPIRRERKSPLEAT